ncbi:hypothetical protein A2U01_0043670, partial [Trifolium medium]|nr:hypothetical protein [Trifolium medium]
MEAGRRGGVDGGDGGGGQIRSDLKQLQLQAS